MDLQRLQKIADNEEECRKYFRELREKNGLKCANCNSKKHYWYDSTWQWKCKSCSKPTTLRSNTILMHSNLPISTWFKAILILNSSKDRISASEMQRLLNMKRYESVWFMMHKLRLAMGQTLVRMVEFSSFEIQSIKDKKISIRENKKTNQPNRKVRISAALIEKTKTTSSAFYQPILIHSDIKYNWQDELSKKDKSIPRRRYFLKRLNRHLVYNIKANPKSLNLLKDSDQSDILINLESKISAVHKGVSLRYLQKYLDEFCFFRLFNSIQKFKFGITFSLLNESWGIPSS